MKGFYDPNNLHHPREIAGSSLRPLSKIPHCCLQRESGPYLSPSVTGHPLRPVKDHRLGGPFPHQQSNLTQAHQKTIHISFFIPDLQEFFGRFLRVTHPFATLPDSEESFRVRLACVMHAASVPSEPGSNSP